jgi:hypothetical protein
MLAENTFINNSLMETGIAAVYHSEEASKASPLAALVGRMRSMDAGCRDARLLPASLPDCSSIDAFTLFRRPWDRFSEIVFNIADDLQQEGDNLIQ